MNLTEVLGEDWFDESTIRVERTSGEVEVELLNDEGVIGLSGAISGSVVRVTTDGRTVRMEVQHPIIRSMRRDLLIQDNVLLLYNTAFLINPNYWGNDLAALSVSVQARAAHTLSVDFISTYAFGDFYSASNPNAESQWSGYWIWPRLGFDGPLPASFFDHAPPEVMHFRQVSDLMRDKQLSRHWFRFGSALTARFDPSPGSYSTEMLAQYASERGISLK